MIPEITMGITKTARRATLKRIRAVNPTASRNEMMFTRITVTNAKPMVNR